MKSTRSQKDLEKYPKKKKKLLKKLLLKKMRTENLRMRISKKI
jgi:hypothetical protein